MDGVGDGFDGCCWLGLVESPNKSKTFPPLLEGCVDGCWVGFDVGVEPPKSKSKRLTSFGGGGVDFG